MIIIRIFLDNKKRQTSKEWRFVAYLLLVPGLSSNPEVKMAAKNAIQHTDN